MTLKKGTFLFAGWNPDHLPDAKKYIDDNKLTKSDIELLSNEKNELLIRTKRDIEIHY